MTRTRGCGSRCIAWVAVGALLAVPLAAGAQAREGFVLDRYRAPATLEDGFARPLPDVLGHLRFSAALAIDYAREPLLLVRARNDSSVGAVVSDQLSAQLALAVGLGERFQAMVHVPATLWQSGESPSLTDVSFEAPSAFAPGDPSIGGAVSILDDRRDPVGLGIELAIPLPLASADDFASDDGFGARGQVVVSARRGPVRVSLDGGVAIRPPRDFDTVAIGPELLYGAGVYGDAARGLVVGGELFGATTLRDGQAFSKYATPLEVLAGVRYTHATGLTFGAGATAGLGPSPGTPAFRVLGTAGWLMPGGAAEQPAPEPAAPPPAPPPPPPPGDRDGDGLLDPDDACPDEPEDRDTFEDEDGCPDPDNDRDDILDADDRCPMEPEDRDGFEDEDGCPDPDNDQDRILDPQDQCPNEPESANGVEDEDGCPDTVRIEGAEIRILQRIEFEFNRDVIRPESFHIIEEVGSVITAHPEITLVRVAGHTDDRGPVTYNLNLSQRRAEAVMRFLGEHGVELTRLEAVGFGESRPLTENRTEAGRQQNRRVEFRIIGGPQSAAAEPQPQGAVP